ncbi:MAG: endonuclease/exonuclease/phosphatase family protein, partial [Rhodospirillaceae bacterium]|nr:endonuclease/exonuclease/phosphatase family protein [Rhodospirillaceae bacterium]
MSQTKQQSGIRIASFNLENLDGPPRGRISVAKRIEILRPQLVRLRADVLCLQEVNGQNESDGSRSLRVLDEVLEGTPYADFNQIHSQSPSGKGARDRHNLVTLSRFPISNFEEVCHTRMDPPLYKSVTAIPHNEDPVAIGWDRPVLLTELNVGEESPLHVINVHLRAPRAAFIPGQKLNSKSWKSMPGWAEGYFMAAIKQSGQALEVRFLIDEIFDANPRALICVVGDFNADD